MYCDFLFRPGGFKTSTDAQPVERFKVPQFWFLPFICCSFLISLQPPVCPIWCSVLLIDGPLLGFCVWSNISSLSDPSGNNIQTNKKSSLSLGLALQMKKIISADVVCICDWKQIFNKFAKLKLKPPTEHLTCWLMRRMLIYLQTELV